ncbi:MAG: radical SAM protein [Candidatus Gracilibacteria bacterium]|nr:radical SAM protein [bacterium]MDZ4217039.1 radical SAM protein [Candidatus Gracilibacteria bacterium]
MKNYQLINSLEKLESLFDLSYKIPNREEFSKYIFQHPLRFTPYLVEQIKCSPAVAKQYIPDPKELDKQGLEKTFTGIIGTGIPGLERMYLDRVILMPSSQCFAYCRFCFRKNYSHDANNGDYGSPQNNFKKALEYIGNDSRIKEVLITGGDPLMFPGKVIELILKLRTIAHLTGIRIGTRIFTSDPELINEDWIRPFTVLNTISTLPIPAPVSISPHINHPDELTPQSIRALLLCTQNRIPLYNQTVLLKGINDDPELLIQLFRQLRQLGIEPYRVYHADPLQGSEHFRTSLKEFMTIKREMRAKASGRIVPSFIMDTRIGKVELGADAEIIKREGNTVWIKTPYTREIYQAVNPEWKLPEFCQLSDNGQIIVPYEDATKKEDFSRIKISLIT